MTVDYTKVEFSSKKKEKAIWESFDTKVVARFIKQLYNMSSFDIKMNKKIQKKLTDKSSNVCAFVHFRWVKKMSGEIKLRIYIIKKIKC